jgi:hypothetical protein
MTENAFAKKIVDAAFLIHATLGPGQAPARARLGADDGKPTRRLTAAAV